MMALALLFAVVEGVSFVAAVAGDTRRAATTKMVGRVRIVVMCAVVDVC